MKIDIKIDVLKAKVTVLIGDIESMRKHVPKGVEDHIDGNGYAARCTYKFESECNYPHWCLIHSKSRRISRIAHEATHAASFILGGIGCVASFDNDEIQAYIVQHICEKVELALGD